jgi:prefoldin subunit 5
MEWDIFVDWMLKALLGGVVLHGVHILSEMKKSIDALNNKMAKIIERTEWHSKEIDRLDQRMTRLEESCSHG